MNVRRCQPDIETEVYVVRGRTTGSSDAGKVVKVVVDAARQLVGGIKHGGGSEYWDGLGICTWESFGKRSESRLLPYPIGLRANWQVVDLQKTPSLL
jgi:hypothetical protein